MPSKIGYSRPHHSLGETVGFEDVEGDSRSLRRRLAPSASHGSGGPMSKIEEQVQPAKASVESDQNVSLPAQASGDVDWGQVREWDERYVFHVLATAEGCAAHLVERADGW